MAEQYAYGLSTFKSGAIGTGGIMGGTLAALPLTAKDTVKFVAAEGAVKTFEADNKPRPVIAMVSGGSIETIEATFYDVTPASLALLLGGTAVAAVPYSAGPPEVQAVPAKYEANTTIPQIEKSFEIVTKNGVKTEVVRGLISGSIDWGMGDSGAAMVKAKITILEPTDGTSKAYTITMPASA